jgi:hypothetical protein
VRFCFVFRVEHRDEEVNVPLDVMDASQRSLGVATVASGEVLLQLLGGVVGVQDEGALVAMLQEDMAHGLACGDAGAG